jgi:ADP-ribose pyrophosphatase YjhB (NUDIX family)
MKPGKKFGRWAYQIAHVVRVAYWCLLRPRTHGVQLIIMNDSRVLLVKHTYMNRSAWGLPGGGISRNEGALACARRELREELGLAGEFLEIGIVNFVHAFRRDLVHVFLVDTLSGDLQLNETELAEAQWFDADRLPDNLTKLAGHILYNAQLSWRGACHLL